MAELIVEVCKIEAICPHNNADTLEIVQIKGWQCVVRKGQYKPGDLITYVPIDAMLPRELSDRWGITNYLVTKPSAPDWGRVRCARLRGEPSFGVIIDREDPTWELGQDVKEFYGIQKYEPPVVIGQADMERNHRLWVKYTDLENLRNFPDIFEPGEDVILTEKLHGTNSMVGLLEGEWIASSHKNQRKAPEGGPEAWCKSLYWFPLSLEPVRLMLEAFAKLHTQVLLYGEIFGRGVQELHYGQKEGLGYRAFDLLLDGRYVNNDTFFMLCQEWGVPAVPVLYQGPFDIDLVKSYSRGNTTLQDTHVREGVVIKPIYERVHPKIGRVGMKYISDDYLLSKTAEKNVTLE